MLKSGPIAPSGALPTRAFPMAHPVPPFPDGCRHALDGLGVEVRVRVQNPSTCQQWDLATNSGKRASVTLDELPTFFMSDSTCV